MPWGTRAYHTYTEKPESPVFSNIYSLIGINSNNKWGEFVITPALMMGMDDIILDRISFGGVKELQEIYE